MERLWKEEKRREKREEKRWNVVVK
jgi:hypothetical protein